MGAAAAEIRFVTVRRPLEFLRVFQKAVGAGTASQPDEKLSFVRLTAHAKAARRTKPIPVARQGANAGQHGE
jgi:hypothetical protein